MSFNLKKTAVAVATVAAISFSMASNAGYGVPMPAPAPMPGGNWYMGVFGGGAFTSDLKGVTTTGDNYSFKTGYDAGVALGYRTGPFRFEGQYTFIRASLDDVTNASGSFISAGGALSGRLRTNAVMANVFYDFNEISDNFGVYLGAGVGMANLRWNVTASGAPILAGTFTVAPATATNNEFAYQGMLGFNYNLDNNFVIDVGYRYFGAAKPVKFSSDRYQSHLVNLGLTYHVPA